MEDKYNGWTNYATWRVNLELFDGMTQRDLTGRAIAPRSEIAEALREFAQDAIESTSDEGLARDYALAFLADVNWWEIADHIVGEDDADDADDEE